MECFLRTDVPHRLEKRRTRSGSKEQRANYGSARLSHRTLKRALFCIPAVFTIEMRSAAFEMRSIVHKRRIQYAGRSEWEHGCNTREEFLLRHHASLGKTMVQKYSAYICFNKWMRFPEGKDRDRARGIDSHPGKLFKEGGIVGERPAVPTNHFNSRSPKEERSSVIAEPLPLGEHCMRRAPRERGKCRKAADKRPIFWQNSRYLRLLEHNFGNENAIRFFFSGYRVWK